MRGSGQDESGWAACFVQADTSEAYLLWTYRDALAFGYVQRGDGNANTRFDWWISTDFQG